MSDSKRKRWRITAAAAILLTVVTFTPLVTPVEVHEPVIAGMPFTLWSGILVTIGFVLLTYAATQYFPFDDAGEKEDL